MEESMAVDVEKFQFENIDGVILITLLAVSTHHKSSSKKKMSIESSVAGWRQKWPKKQVHHVIAL